MYYSYRNKLYTKDSVAISGQTFDETDKPEPLFTLEEMKQFYDDIDIYKMWTDKHLQDYFKQQFNITI